MVYLFVIASGALAAGTIASPWSTAAGAPDTNGSGGADAKHLDVGDASDDEKVQALTMSSLTNTSIVSRR